MMQQWNTKAGGFAETARTNLSTIIGLSFTAYFQGSLGCEVSTSAEADWVMTAFMA
jgi:hypothetical protein